jgi:predicted histidine transporter YuiF (NhaC family)
MDALILIGSLVVLLLVGFPVAFAVGLSAFIGAWWIDLPLEAVVIQITNGINKFSLLTIPFFILAGAIMAEGGIARRLEDIIFHGLSKEEDDNFENIAIQWTSSRTIRIQIQLNRRQDLAMSNLKIRRHGRTSSSRTTR